tara:strand:- start:5902 stop:6363 length:462 start_codon:yes stop_codon:yes gene_type:complete
MKTYRFKVEAEEPFFNTALLDSIKNEVKDEKRQRAFTNKVNAKTTKMHSEILADFIRPLQRELEEIGVVFNRKTSLNHTNTYHQSYVDILFADFSSSEVRIVGISEGNSELSKYTTFYGKYAIRVNGTKVHNCDDVLKFLRGNIKNHLIETNK